MRECPECEGTGIVKHIVNAWSCGDYYGYYADFECEACDGTGEIDVEEKDEEEVAA